MDTSKEKIHNMKNSNTALNSIIDISIRRRFANIMLIGVLFYVYAAINLILVADIFMNEDHSLTTIFNGTLTAIWCSLMIVAGYSVRRFKKWGMILAIIVSIMAVLIYPFNIIPASIILYYLLRARECFSEDFRKDIFARLAEPNHQVTPESSPNSDPCDKNHEEPAKDYL